MASGRGLILDFLCGLAATNPKLDEWIQSPQSILELNTLSIEHSLARVRNGIYTTTLMRSAA